MPAPVAVYFTSASEFRDWLTLHGTAEREIVLGFFKVGSGLAGISYQEALDQALCFGWIDGIRRRIDEARYSVRFSPRKPRSIWSRINTRRATRLKALGLMQPSGLRAFAARTKARTGVYSFENAPRALSAEFQARFRKNPAAWRFFQSRPPWYRRTASFWVMNGKKPETCQKRLSTLILDSSEGRLIGLLRRD